MSKGYKHIFFDLDHTLWDFVTNSAETLRELYSEFGLEKYALFHFESFKNTFSEVNARLWEAYNAGSIDKSTLRNQRFFETFTLLGLPKHLHPADITPRYIASCSDKSAVLPHAHETLQYLQHHYSLSIVTNGFPEAQSRKLKSSGLAAYFTDIIISEEVGYAKPDSRIFEFALDKAGVHKSEAIMIGDNYEVDISGAGSAGIASIWFNPAGIQKKDMFCRSISALSELRHIL